MKRILVTSAGGTPATNVIRSLRDAPEKFYIISVDANKYNLQRAEGDERYLVPFASDKNYLSVLLDIAKRRRVQFIHPQWDEEIAIISQYRDKFKKAGIKLFLPSHKTIKICQNKYLSAMLWKKAGLVVPETMLIHNKGDLKKAFKNFGKPIWLRAIESPGGGRGSIKVDRFEIACAWIDFNKGWGDFVAAECLKPNSVTWMSLWKNGELVVAQGRKRLYWEFSNRAPSGVTGITGTGVTVSDKLVDKIAQRVVLAIDRKPNGIFSVDMTYNRDNIPNPTEINIARFFTTSYFFTELGLNLPYLYVRLAFNEKLPNIKQKINPLPSDFCWVRGMDFLPVLTTVQKIKESERELYERLKKLNKKIKKRSA